MAEHANARCMVYVPFWKFIQEEELIPTKDLTKVISTVSDLEFGIQKQTKGLDDFQKLIDFLMCLRDMLTQATKDQQKMYLDKKINEILLGAIGSRFGIAFQHCSMNMEFWKHHIDVYLKVGWYDSITEIYEKYASTLGQTDPTLWIEAGLYPLHRKRSAGIQEARVILQRCLRCHPTDPRVFLGLLRIELMYQDFLNLKMAKQGNEDHYDVENEEDRKSRDCFQAFFDQAISTSIGKTPAFYIKVYQLFNNYPWTSPKRKTAILIEMERQCRASEETHDFLANLELDGGMNEVGNIMNCFKAYDKGTRRVSTQRMYKLYLSVHGRILRNSEFANAKVKRLVLENMMEVCRGADKLKFLTREDYKDWLLAVKQLGETYMKPKTEAEFAADFIPNAVWMKREKEKYEKFPAANKLFKTDDEEQNGDDEKLQKLSCNVEQVVDAALLNFPRDAEFVEFKIGCILDDPVNLHLQYGSLRVASALQYLKGLGTLDGDPFSIYRKIYQYCIGCHDCEEQTQKLIQMAPQDGGIQSRLAEEYLRFIYISELGSGIKANKFLKGLQKANRKPVEVGIMKFAEILRSIPPPDSGSDDSGHESADSGK